MSKRKKAKTEAAAEPVRVDRPRAEQQEPQRQASPHRAEMDRLWARIARLERARKAE